MKELHIVLVVWARPNFMKVAPIIRELKKHPVVRFELIHTGQHFDKNMSDSFFEDLGLPYPDVNFEIHGGTSSEQIGRIMCAFDAFVRERKPDCVLVVGDVNSTVACAIVTKQNQIPLVHVESGLRSRDMSMPEEINRILTDRISDMLFVTEASGMKNLQEEGIADGVFFAGNVMIDCLVENLPAIQSKKLSMTLGLIPREYILVTLHRPSNVDRKERLESILSYLQQISSRVSIVMPLHPRTKKKISEFWLDHYLADNPNIRLLDPLGYIDFISLLSDARCILTDSGWVQEESTYLGIPCLTMRLNTERPVTCDVGTNTLVGEDFDELARNFDAILADTYKSGNIPDLWDGKAAERIVSTILHRLWR